MCIHHFCQFCFCQLLVVVLSYGAAVVQSYGAQDLTSGTPLVLQKVHLLGQHLRDQDDWIATVAAGRTTNSPYAL